MLITDAMITTAAAKLQPMFSKQMAEDIVRELLEAALSSAHPAPAQEVEVTPLVWSHRNEEPKHEVSADCPFGRYHILNRGEYGFGWCRPRCPVPEGFEPTEEAAKAAAQQDYESRIRSAIVSPATDKLALAREALRPFDAMAKYLFSSNWDASNVVLETYKVGGQTAARLTAGDFFAVRAALSTIEESET